MSVEDEVSADLLKKADTFLDNLADRGFQLSQENIVSRLNSFVPEFFVVFFVVCDVENECDYFYLVFVVGEAVKHSPAV